MFKLASIVAVAGLAFAAQPSSAQAVQGPDAASCRGSGPAVLVNVSGLKNREGLLRINLYGGNASDFLVNGKKLRRVEVPVTSGSMRVCVAVPGPGNYAVAVRHDADDNGKSGWNDGGGFSRNPKISLASLKPKHAKVVIPVNGVTTTNIVMNYRRGLSIGPISGL